MSAQVRELQPQPLWNNFADLNAVPRPSKKEGRVIEFMKAFGEKLKLPTQVDDTGNVIIKKPATPGMENRETVILQSHLDMVHQKNSGTEFNFDTDGINMFVDGDWVKARGTTLGADNGIGVASIMSLLASTNIPHPAIEALFTIDEETGMTGALALKGGLLDGRFLLNLDTEEDTELTIGCAGGIDVTASGKYHQINPTGGKAFKISITGLKGGHSGVDIHLGRANANKLMNRLLLDLNNSCQCVIAQIDGGSLRNAIPRESTAVLVIDEAKQDEMKKSLAEFENNVKNEFSFTDPGLNISMEPADMPAQVLNTEFQLAFLRAVYGCPDGIYRMTPSIPGLVQSSNNVARVLVKDGSYQVQCLTRSSVNSEKMDLAQTIRAVFELIGATVSYGGSYPGWEPRPDSEIVTLMSGLYKELFGESPGVNAIHAGLECGILGTNYPGMQMISFGPNIYGAHSPDERVQISSVQKFWGYLLETLKRFPLKAS